MKHMPSKDVIQQLVEEQLVRWNKSVAEKRTVARPVITISREPGCNGGAIAETLARELKLDLYSGKIVEEVARSAKMSASVVATLDEKGHNFIDDWISILEKDRNLWSYQYMDHLARVMGTIARHGQAIILGRGGSFLIAPELQLRIRLVAPRDARIKNVMKRFGVARKEAEQRVSLVESERRSYINKYFNADINDPVNYDLVINTAFIRNGAITEMIKSGLKSKNLI